MKRIRVLVLLTICCAMWLPMHTGMATTVNAANVLANIPQDFTFLSGAGGWSTEISIYPDGTFIGLFEDMDMGDDGDGRHPYGTVYICSFSGSFRDIVKISEYEYAMQIATLKQDGIEGEEKIVDGVRVVTSGPYGFDNAGEFRLYLPGMRTADLPQAFLDWVQGPSYSWRGGETNDFPDTLPFYGLYNVGGEQGFLNSQVVYGDPDEARSFRYGALGTSGTPGVSATDSASHPIGTVTVSADSVRIRNRPSVDGNPLAILYAGESYPCVGQDASGFYKIFAKDYIAYVPQNAVTFSTQGAQAAHNSPIVGIVQVTSNDFANIRARPTQDSEKLAGVCPGIALDCIGVADNGWFHIVLPSGETGYFSGKLGRLSETP